MVYTFYLTSGKNGLPSKSGSQKRREKIKLKAMRAKGVKGQKQHGFQGRIQDFPKGGVETRDTKCGGGGGVLSTLGPTRKAGSGGGGGGGGGEGGQRRI